MKTPTQIPTDLKSTFQQIASSQSNYLLINAKNILSRYPKYNEERITKYHLRLSVYMNICFEKTADVSVCHGSNDPKAVNLFSCLTQ